MPDKLTANYRESVSSRIGHCRAKGDSELTLSVTLEPKFANRRFI